MRREVHVRFCERLAVTFGGLTPPGSHTRRFSRLELLPVLCREANAVNEICVSRIGAHGIKSRFSSESKDQFLRADLICLSQPGKRLKVFADARIKHGTVIGITRIRLPLRQLLFEIHTPILFRTKSIVRSAKSREALSGSFFAFTVKNSSFLLQINRFGEVAFPFVGCG